MHYHFVLTMTFRTQQHSWDGEYVVKPGETRLEAYRALVEATKRRVASMGIPSDQYAILFFSFEPNALGSDS